MSELLVKSSFDPYLNEKFEIHSESGDKLEVELVEVSDHSNEHIDGFSVIFRGPLENVFHQDTYKVTHNKMGEISLFLGPIIYGKTDATYYESVFSRLKEK
jgi:hypothetical protein